MPAARGSRARRGATCSITGCCALRRRRSSRESWSPRAFLAALARTGPARPKELRKEPRAARSRIGGGLVAFFVAAMGDDAARVRASCRPGVILLAAVLQESHRLAFRDELTNLPSRRALEEPPHGPGPTYASAW